MATNAMPFTVAPDVMPVVFSRAQESALKLRHPSIRMRLMRTLDTLAEIIKILCWCAALLFVLVFVLGIFVTMPWGSSNDMVIYAYNWAVWAYSWVVYYASMLI